MSSTAVQPDDTLHLMPLVKSCRMPTLIMSRRSELNLQHVIMGRCQRAVRCAEPHAQ